MERRAMIEPKKYPTQRRRALFDLEEYGVSYKQIMEAYEYSRNDRSMENKSADNGEDGLAGNSRPRER
jgi:hypothetical protein